MMKRIGISDLRPIIYPAFKGIMQ